MRLVGPHPALFLRLRPVGLALRGATFSQREKDTPSVFSLNWDTSVANNDEVTWLFPAFHRLPVERFRRKLGKLNTDAVRVGNIR